VELDQPDDSVAVTGLGLSIQVPEVNVMFRKSHGSATTHQPLILAFTRSAPYNVSLGASFDLEGTAIPGISDGNGGAIPSDADYICPPDHQFHLGVNPITFNAGQEEVDITLTPTDGSPNTSDKTILVTVLPDSNPVHGDPPIPHYTTLGFTAVGIITDRPQWKITSDTVAFDSQKILKDDGSGDYGAPPAQWVDSNANDRIDQNRNDEHSYPISYRRSLPGDPTRPTLAIDLKTTAAANGDTFKLTGISDKYGLTFHGTAVVAAGAGGESTLQFSGLQPSEGQKITDTIDFVADFKIKWTLTDSNNGTSSSFESEDRLYVTGDSTNNGYETVLFLGCSGAKDKKPHDPNDASVAGYKDDLAVTDAIWSKFKNRDTKNVMGQPMKYWGPATNETHVVREEWWYHTAGLLKNLDGRCNAWAELFRDTLSAQGVSSKVAGITGITDPPPETPPAGWSNQTRAFEVSAAAQNNVNAWHVFPDHAVVKLNAAIGGDQAIYDPSYGGTGFFGATVAEAEQKWEDASVVGVRWFYIVGDAATGHYGSGTTFTRHTPPTRQTEFHY